MNTDKHPPVIANEERQSTYILNPPANAVDKPLTEASTAIDMLGYLLYFAPGRYCRKYICAMSMVSM